MMYPQEGKNYRTSLTWNPNGSVRRIPLCFRVEEDKQTEREPPVDNETFKITYLFVFAMSYYPDYNVVELTQLYFSSRESDNSFLGIQSLSCVNVNDTSPGREVRYCSLLCRNNRKHSSKIMYQRQDQFPSD